MRGKVLAGKNTVVILTSAPKRGANFKPKRERKMALRPLNDRIIAKRLEQESVSKGGILIPDSAKEKPAKAVVIAVGPGKLAKDGSRMPMEIKVGDEVLFGKYAGSEVKLDGEEHVILKQDDILAIIE